MNLLLSLRQLSTGVSECQELIYGDFSPENKDWNTIVILLIIRRDISYIEITWAYVSRVNVHKVPI